MFSLSLHTHAVYELCYTSLMYLNLAWMPVKYEKLTCITSPRETCDAECADNLVAYIWCLCLAIVTVSCFPGIHVELSCRLRNYRT